MGEKYIVVYGGIHGDNQYLSDISFLNMGISLIFRKHGMGEKSH
jgi:hypothetical protein